MFLQVKNPFPLGGIFRMMIVETDPYIQKMESTSKVSKKSNVLSRTDHGYVLVFSFENFSFVYLFTYLCIYIYFCLYTFQIKISSYILPFKNVQILTIIASTIILNLKFNSSVHNPTSVTILFIFFKYFAFLLSEILLSLHP